MLVLQAAVFPCCDMIYFLIVTQGLRLQSSPFTTLAFLVYHSHTERDSGGPAQAMAQLEAGSSEVCFGSAIYLLHGFGNPASVLWNLLVCLAGGEVSENEQAIVPALKKTSC